MYFGVCSSFTIVNETTLLRQRARRSCSKTGRSFQILANYDVCFDKFGRFEFKYRKHREKLANLTSQRESTCNGALKTPQVD